MTLYRIENERVSVGISDRGAALQSLRSADGTEYLWQRDPRYWEDSDLTIFPYVARLTEGAYTYRGERYEMPIHGIAPYRKFETAGYSDPGEGGEPDRSGKQRSGIVPDQNALTMTLRWDEDTLKQYPFRFVLTRRFELEDSALTVTARVENRDEKTMFFGYGGHPGFNVPLEAGESFSDYSIRFEQPCTPRHVIFTEDCFVTEERRPFTLQEGRSLPLEHRLFDHDAIVLTDMCRDVSIVDGAGRRRVRVEFPDQPYLGLWHRPRTDAPYVCIEPWNSLPSRAGVVEDLEEQPDLIRLEPGKVWETSYIISIFEGNR